MRALCVHISEPEIKNAFWYNFFMWILNTLVAIESSYFSVCQHVPVQISNWSASVVALTAFVRHLPHVRPHLYLKTWCVYAREVLVTFVCLSTSMYHLVFLQLMYDSFSDVGENRVYFASKILTPCRMHWNAFLIAQIIAKCHSFPNM